MRVPKKVLFFLPLENEKEKQVVEVEMTLCLLLIYCHKFTLETKIYFHVKKNPAHMFPKEQKGFSR